MGTTPSGLPYPEPTDPVAEGADAIRALAEAIELKVGDRVAVVKGSAVTDANVIIGLANPLNPKVPILVMGQVVGGTPNSAQAQVTSSPSSAGYLVVRLFNSQTFGPIANVMVAVELLAVYDV